MSAPPPAAEPHPDAGIFALCAEHIANRRAFSACPDDEGDEHDLLWSAYMSTYEAISAVQRPRTLDGMRAIARAAKVEASGPGGAEHYSGTRAGDWAWALLGDLLAEPPIAGAP